MSDKSRIEWTDATWNPIRGCSRVSAGCQHCYAETVAHRFSKPGMPYAGLIHPTTKGWNGKVTFVPEVLDQPIRWKKPRLIFVNSMSDLFHETVSNEVIAAIFGVMAATPHHTYQVLTKRPDRMLVWFNWHAAEVKKRDFFGQRQWQVCEDEAAEHIEKLPAIGCQSGWPLRNVWLGVSVENQQTADERIPVLIQCPASVRWLSCEPLLGSIRVESPNDPQWRLPQISWVVAGGESGRGARPMHPAWARSLRDQCASVGVPFFFKQWGEWAPYGRGTLDSKLLADRTSLDEPVQRFGKKLAGRLLDGVEHNAYPVLNHG